jgi:hypothetical protein
MADNWSERERQTNRLVRSIAAWLIAQKNITADQLFGLIRLTWITAGHINKDAYVESVKIPALGKIMGRAYSKMPLAKVARDVAEQIGVDGVEALVLRETGFTNIYNPYRNSSARWVRDNFQQIFPLVKLAHRMTSDAQGRSLAGKIEKLPAIEKPDQTTSAMHPASLLTPLMFSLDKRIRFPIINARKHVRNILIRRGADRGTLPQKYDAMIGLYGKGGIEDAADLDQVSDELEDFLSGSEGQPKRRLLQKKKEDGKRLPLKDESDLEIVQKERTAARRKLHNKMTNRLRELWADYTLTEGAGTSAQYDVMIKHYNDSGQDLIVEVKSSSETANLRMAVGQLFSYSYSLNKKREFDLCVLLPEKPTPHDSQWLEWLEIGLIWFSGDKLETNCDWLAHLT